MSKKPISQRKILTTEEAADFLDGFVTKNTLKAWRKVGKGPRFVNIEGRIGYRIDDLNDYVEKCVQVPGDGFAA